MLVCQRCNSSRMVKVMAKAAGTMEGLGTMRFEKLDIPDLTDGEYLRFTYCLTCGQVQGSFPTPPLPIELQSDIHNGLGEDG